MSNVVVSLSARTDVGRQRAGNEDSFLVSDLTGADSGLDPGETQHTIGERGSLLVVSDGMGGAAAGEIASEMAVTTVRDALVDLPLDLEVSDRLILAAQSANGKIWSHAQENPELTGMGATLTAVLVQDNEAYIAQVGDSRAYLMRREEIKQLTKDQSLVQLLIEAKMIEPENSSRVPQNVIMQALGTQPEVRVTVTSVQLSSQDGLLLCSDGLSNKVTENEMLETVRGASDLGAACTRLVDMANERGGEDNITVIIARFDGDALTAGDSIDGSVRAVNEDFFSEEAMSAIGSQMAAASTSPSSPGPVEAETEGASLSPPPGSDSPEAKTREPVDEPESSSYRSRRMDYNSILIAVLISLLLIAVLVYFFYVYYLKQPAEPIPTDTASMVGSLGFRIWDL
jgi:serine/threonine protein phosphatase PrpC